METTAAQILNYRGDAAAAVGSSVGGNSGMTSIWGDADLSRINERGDWVTLQNLNKNKALWDAKQAELRKIQDDLASDRMQMGRMLEPDRDYITSNYREKIKQMLIDNPDIASDNKKFYELRDLMGKFSEAKTYAGVRLAEVEKMNADIAKELDPEKRARMEQHRDAVVNQDLYAQVRPYQQILDWDNEIFPEATLDEASTQDMVGDKIVTTKTFRSRLRDFTDKVYQNYIDSANKTMKNKMDKYAESFFELAPHLRQDKIDQWNRKIEQANQDAGLKPGDQYYVKPITMDPQTGMVDANTLEIVRAEAILQKYKNGRTQEEQVSKLPSEIRENDSTTKKNLAEANLKIPAEVAKLRAEADKIRADREKTLAEAANERDKLAEKEAQGSFYIQEVVNAFSPKNYQGLGRLENNQFVYRNSEGKEVATAIPGMKGQVSGTVVHYNEGGVKMMGLSDMQLNILGIRDEGGFKEDGTPASGTVVTKPDLVIYNNKNTKDPYFIVRYPADDKGKAETRIVRPNQYLKAAIKDVLGDKASGKEEIMDYRLTMKEWRKRTGSENINGSIFTEMEKPEYQGTESQLERKRSAFKK